MMKKSYFIVVIVLIVVLLVGLFITKNLKKEKEETKQVNPPSLPGELQNQQEAIIKALELYQKKKQEGMKFSSQCLGVVYGGKTGYAVDIVHVPRNEEDNKPENQCEAYRNGSVRSFIELDKDGNIVRVV